MTAGRDLNGKGDQWTDNIEEKRMSDSQRRRRRIKR
jgi:hypothetical protein